MKIARHLCTTALALLLLVGVPILKTGYLGRLISGADSVSGATTVIDQPSGSYVVLINRARHPDEEKAAVWEDFFSGGEIGVLFDDISCLVADSDQTGKEIAESLQSRLPENQMKLRLEDVTLIFSKVFYGKYDAVLLSGEIWDRVESAGWKAGQNDLVIKAEGV